LSCLQECHVISVAVWHIGSTLVSINKVTLYQAQLVLGWVTVVTGDRLWVQLPVQETCLTI